MCNRTFAPPPPPKNQAQRIILHTRVATYLLFVLTLALTFYDRLKTCTSVLLVWLGLGPMQVGACHSLLLRCSIWACSVPGGG